MPETFQVAGEAVTLYHAGGAGPAVYLPVFEGDGADIWRQCRALGCGAFSLAAFSVRSWDDDLTPWDCPPIFKGDKPCHGRAPEQLELLETKIMPAVEARLEEPGEPGPPARSILAGYSLGGLFATWAAFQTDAFASVASMSGSMWFPGFADYVAAHDVSPAVGHAYFSLGDKESHTRNKVLKTVADDTRAVVAAFQEKGVDTAFEWNPGNHFMDEPLRTAKGIRWALGR